MKKDSFNHPRKYNILAAELLSQREKKGWQDKAQSFLTPQRLQTFGATASVVVVVRRNGSCHRRRSSTVVVGPKTSEDQIQQGVLHYHCYYCSMPAQQQSCFCQFLAAQLVMTTIETNDDIGDIFPPFFPFQNAKPPQSVARCGL